MKIVVLGYHNIGFICLAELISAKANVQAVFTHQDNPKENIWFNSVETLAKKNNIPVYTPANINEKKSVNLIKKLAPDIIFSFYFRNLVSKEILNIPKMGCINLHGSLLPKYRGRCPINWVLVNGETKTGVTLHYMEEKPDKGDIIAQKEVVIDFTDTAFTLFNKMNEAARILFKETFPLIKENQLTSLPQNQKEASYFGGRKPADGKIDWGKSALEIYNLVRAVTHPYPGAFTFLKDKKVFIWSCEIIDQDSQASTPGTIEEIIPDKGIVIATGQGKMLLKNVQFENAEEKNNIKIQERLA